MIKYLFLFISLVKGCFIDIKNNTLIKENCFIEINNKNNYGHNYILELPIKENNLIKFDWHNLNSLVNIKFSWYNTVDTFKIPNSYNLLYTTGSMKIPYEKNDLYHCDNLLCTEFTNNTKSGIMYIYISSNSFYLSGILNFVLEINNNFIKEDQLNILKNIWNKCCSKSYIMKPPDPYILDKQTHCNWKPTPWDSWNNITDCENIYNIDCDKDGYIQHLFLSNKGLNCDISDIQNLTRLKLVDLSLNFIKSDIKIFNKINNITELNLAHNLFYGDINDLNIKNVNKLNLKFNKINGNVYIFIINHNEIKLFDISYNDFEYQLIPKFNEDIEYINIGRNNFYGYLDNILNYKQLKVLDISFNNFNKELDLSHLNNLDILNIRNNGFTKFFILPNNLKHYDASNNLIDDNINKIDINNNAYVDISNNNIKIIFNDNLKTLINKYIFNFDNNNFICDKNKLPLWIYYYYPNINKCQNNEQINVYYNNKNYYTGFVFFLILFLILFAFNIGYSIYYYKKIIKKEEKPNIEKQRLVN
jgi:hypothetical protein